MKKILWSLAVYTLLTMDLAIIVAQPRWPQVNNETKAGSRWWWHGSAVNQENLKWNISEYAKAGIGTLEITPIYGVKGNSANNILFMSSQWLDMFQYAVEQGREHGIDIDMTTGTGWPFGGPMVKLSESACKLGTEEIKITGDGSKEQTMTLTKSIGQLQRVLAFPQSGNNGTVTDLTEMVDGKKVKWTAPMGNWRIIAVFCEPGVMQVKRPSPGSEGYVLDYFDAEASKGLAAAGLESRVPVLFGVLTCDTLDQALIRAGSKAGNKGADCAVTAIEMANLLKNIRRQANTEEKSYNA